MSNKKLLEPFKLGKIELKNRILMPPMTRSRSVQPGDIPAPMMVEYYCQRAEAGLIITEGTQISPMGKGYSYTPGIYSKEQIEGWKAITSAVHKKGGKIFAQIWHVGRISHTDILDGKQPISSSDIQAEGVKVFVAGDLKQTSKPRPLSKDEINEVVSQFKQAAANAIDAGFDGIELHAANGYLVNQFIDSGANNRTDEYGGILENRLRFLKEVVESMSAQIGSDRIGVRLAPLTTLNGCADENPQKTYIEAAKLLDKLKVLYIHIAEADWDDAPDMSDDFKKEFRNNFSGAMLYAGKYDAEKAEKFIQNGLADMIAFGRPFVANPDLVNRIRNGYPWAKHEPTTLFGGDEKGLVDYPAYK